MLVPKIKGLLSNIGVQVIIAMIIGSAVGAVMGADATMFAPLGEMFIKLIKMLVVPLVAVAIVSGSAGLGNSHAAGKVGFATLGFFGVTSAVAVALALGMGNLLGPGKGVDISDALAATSQVVTAAQGDLPSATDTLLGMVPNNVFISLTSGNILQILVFCMFFGLALSKVTPERRDPVLNGINGVIDAMVWMINQVMKIAPIGVFGLMADAVGTYGFEELTSIFDLAWVYLLAIALYGFVFYPLVVKVLGGVSPVRFLTAMKRPQAVALSTASSMSTLPITMDTCEKELGVSKTTSSFVLPLGATINMSGNAIYYGIVAIFFAQMYGIDLSMSAYAAIILTSTLGAVGQAGVPGPSFLVVAVLLAAGIPIDGLPLLFALDRVFDMIRTALNITGDAACAVVVENLIAKDKTAVTESA
uniref:dicarboxylate/amino acid:cation symporter n=1 Tax=Thaumasiovibrio occultus TaxID=1891184 RepID=UPI000B35ECCE|nr:dicarboxylate/amino acid:cation symporter [Thaumasiovibrio occultus]